jgi:hypothetical protein
MKKQLMVLALIVLILISGCGKEEARMPEGVAEAPAPAPKVAAPGLDKFKLGTEVASKRYIATSYHIVVETTEGELPTVWESVQTFCRTNGCDIVSSSITKETPYAPPSGSLFIRVLPQNLKRVLEHLGSVGSIIQQTTESEDKTTVVIDVEAKIKNLTELRNRLRAMLTGRAGSVKDVVEVERELFRVQAELDSLTTKRALLANETEKVAVEIDFRSQQSIAETGAFAPIIIAWHEAGRVFAQSIAAAITFIVAIVPWMFLIVPSILFVPRLFKKLFRRRVDRKSRQKNAK